MIDFVLVAVVVVVHSDDNLVHVGHCKMIVDRRCNVFYFLHLNESSIGVYFDRVAVPSSVKLMWCDC